MLFLARSLDDNRLTSWNWAFNNVSFGRIFIAILVSQAFAIVLSRFSLPSPRVLFLISFAAAALFWETPEVLIDSSRYFTQAKHLMLNGVLYFVSEWGRGITAWTDMPLIPFIYGLLFKLFGESRICVQVANTFMFSLTAVLTYLIGRGLWDEKVGKTGGILLLGMPLVYSQIPLMLVDIPSMFFLSLAVFTFQKTLERGGAVMTLFASLTVSMAMFSKYSLWIMLSVLAVLILVRATEEPVSVVIKRGLSVFVFAAIFSGAVLFYKLDVVRDQIELLISYQRPGLKRWGEGFISTFFYQVHPFVTVSALFSLYLSVKKRDLRYVAVAWLVFLIFFLQIKRSRYIIPVLPMFALMASYGLRSISSDKLRRFIVLSSVFSSLALSYFAYQPLLDNMSMGNLNEAGNFLNTLEVSSIDVVTLPQKSLINPAVSVPLLDLYTDRKLKYAYTLKPHISMEKIMRSPFRFTWEYRNPVYYQDGRTDMGRDIVVIIYADNRDLPLKYRSGYKLLRTFEMSENIFRFRTFVRIYRRN